MDIVYEDQGPPIRLNGGDCLIQPPEIRHRVLYASEDIEVVEIGVPAQHVTTIDHEMDLPNSSFNPERRFDGQKFVLHRKEGAALQPFRLPGFQCRETGISAGTGGVASVQIACAPDGPPVWAEHAADIHFTFVLEGSMILEGEEQDPQPLSEGDAFVIPPGMRVRYSEFSPDLELLEVALPGNFETSSGS